MPEFQLDRDSTEDARRFADLPEFLQGYIEAAFFCGVEVDGVEESVDGAEFAFADLDAESLKDAAIECAAFESDNAADLALLYGAEWDRSAQWGAYDAAAAGRDLWFTRNGHGVGFWDRGFEGAAGDAAERVSDAARSMGGVYLMQGAYHRLYFS